MRITTFDTNKGEDVFAGLYDAKKKTFTKVVTPNHFMIKEKGYGIQDDVISKLSNVGCEIIHIITSVQTLEYPFSLYEKKIPKDYGHGTQHFASIKEAKIIKKQTPLPSWLREG